MVKIVVLNLQLYTCTKVEKKARKIALGILVVIVVFVLLWIFQTVLFVPRNL